MTGSAKIRANTNATRPATAPASTPRPISCFSIFGCPLPGGSVAGEAEEVPAVVEELVDHHALAEHRGRALVDADEVVDQEGQDRGPDQQGYGADLGGHDRRGEGACGDGNIAHGDAPSGIQRSHSRA